ncbi:MAG TPA: hypothetical protein PKG95_14435, partial [Anaerolineaceae bacterium]|nr:hypothetical protein [Anaerolineaceae bacterium]
DRMSSSLELVLLYAITAGLGWTITGWALKNQYQLESKHIIRLLLSGIGSGIIIGLVDNNSFHSVGYFLIIGIIGGIVSGIILRKHMHLTIWQMAGLGGGWILSGFFYLVSVFIPSLSGLIMGAISGAIIIAILEAARKRAARQAEHG